MEQGFSFKARFVGVPAAMAAAALRRRVASCNAGVVGCNPLLGRSARELHRVSARDILKQAMKHAGIPECCTRLEVVANGFMLAPPI